MEDLWLVDILTFNKVKIIFKKFHACEKILKFFAQLFHNLHFSEIFEDPPLRWISTCLGIKNKTFNFIFHNVLKYSNIHIP